VKKNKIRTHCPISFALDFFGDKWTFLIIRDLAFKGKHFYNEFLAAEEGIATNILSDRLKKLELIGIISSKKIKEKRIRKKYTLTDKGKDLIPTLIEMIIWSYKHDSETEAGEDFFIQATQNRELLLNKIFESLD